MSVDEQRKKAAMAQLRAALAAWGSSGFPGVFDLLTQKGTGGSHPNLARLKGTLKVEVVSPGTLITTYTTRQKGRHNVTDVYYSDGFAFPEGEAGTGTRRPLRLDPPSILWVVEVREPLDNTVQLEESLTAYVCFDNDDVEAALAPQVA